MHHEHDRKLAVIQEWFAALEPGIAELTVEPSPHGDRYTHVNIRPVRTPDAAEILLRIEQEHGWVLLYAGGVMDDQPDDWPELTFLDACKAIMAGQLTDTIWLWRRKEVAHQGCLHMPRKEKPACGIEFLSCSAPLFLVMGRLLRRIEKRVVHYPPY